MTRFRHRRRSVLTLTLALGAASLAGVGRPADVHAASGGRITLTSPQVVLDTTQRSRTSGPLALVSFGDLLVSGSDDTGDIFVYPCGGNPGEPVASYGPGEFVHLPIVGSTTQCVETSSPVHLIETQIGTIAGAPFAGGLQYVPLVVPQEISGAPRDREAPGGIEVLQLTGIPPEARAAVVMVEAHDPTGTSRASSASVGPCSEANSATAHLPGPGIALGVVPVTAPTATLCGRYTGSPIRQVALLGYLSIEGPDPMRVVPSFGPVESQVPPPGLVPLVPTRVLDTRAAIGVDVAGPIAAGDTVRLDLSEHVTPDTTGVVFNLAVTEPSASGFVSAYPCDADRPTAANINYVERETVSNLVTVKLAADQSVCLFAYSTTHLVLDLAATYELFGGNGIEALRPVRILDTRDGTGAPRGKVAAGQVLALDVSGVGGTPASGISAVTLNLAVTEPDAAGFVTAWPCDAERPTAANVNFAAGQTVPNAVTVGVSAAGTVCLYAYAATHLVADLSAWYGSDNQGGIDVLVPDRLLDTRSGIGTPVARSVAAGGTLAVQVTGRGGVPEGGADAVVMNVAVTEPNLDGFLTVYPCDEGRPLAASLNYDAGETVSNQVTAKLSGHGTICIYTQRRTHVVVDVAGYFSSETAPFVVLGLVE